MIERENGIGKTENNFNVKLKNSNKGEILEILPKKIENNFYKFKMKRWLKKIGEKITGSKPEEEVKEKNKTTTKDTDKIEVIEKIQKDHNTDHNLTVVGADKKNSISSTKLKEKKIQSNLVSQVRR